MPSRIALTPEEVRMNFQSGQRFGSGFGLTPFEQSPGYMAALARTPGNGGSGAIGGVATSTGNAGSIESLTQMVNEINQRAQQAANAGRIPGGSGLEQQSSTNIGSALRGEVPQDVIRLLGQQSAERGVSTGSPMGPASNADYLRSLGLTSLGQMNTGQDWLSAATARNPAAPIYDAGNQVLTAGQRLQAELAREEMANRLRLAQMGNLRGGGGGGYVSGGRTSPIATASSNWQDLLKPDASPGSTSTTTSYPVAAPGQADSLWNMGGNYFGNMLSNYGDAPAAPPSLLSNEWDDLENWFYREPSQPSGPTSLLDSGWDDVFADILGG